MTERNTPTGSTGDEHPPGSAPVSPPPIESPSVVVPTVVPPRRRPWLWAIPAVLVLVVGVVVVVSLVGGDDGGEASGTGVFEGTADENGAAVITTVDLRAGQVVRFRAEPGTDLDVEVLVTMDRAQALAVAEVIAEGSGGADAEEMLDYLFIQGSDELTGAAAAAVEGKYSFQVDDGADGDVEPGWFPVVEPGPVSVVAASYSGAGDVRLIVEVWDETFDVTDTEAIFGDEMFTGPFFDEAAFYDDDAPYQVTGE